ncbi:hypothetical protein AB1Y20_012582 [Prymnesium parvum]|uniref:peptidylprolyl isomerase n=1 Tax=Prymnesium parvum TaxID=97485 RepID=A0AB34IIA1_PRYPA
MVVTVLEELSEGEGPFIKVGDKVVIHSTASVRSSGVVFDDSREGGVAYTVAVGVNKAIQGIDSALQLMRKGSRRRVLITADEAYGEAGLRPHVPPHADVVYDVEVLALNESLVAQGIRVRREEEARVQRFLRMQDEERAAEAAQGKGPQKGGSESSSDESSSSSESSEARRKRRKKEKKRKREKEKKAREKHKSKKHKKEKKEKKAE